MITPKAGERYIQVGALDLEMTPLAALSIA